MFIKMNQLDKRLNFISKEKMGEFCPLIYDCSRQSMDSNCFYDKFLHCKEVDRLNLSSKLSKEDLENRNKFITLQEQSSNKMNLGSLGWG